MHKNIISHIIQEVCNSCFISSESDGGDLINYEWWRLINFCYIKERWVNAWGDSAVPPVVSRGGGRRHVTNRPLETSCFPHLAISLHTGQKRSRGWARAMQSVARETPSWGWKIEALITLLTRTSQQFIPLTQLDCIQITAKVKCVSPWGKARVCFEWNKEFLVKNKDFQQRKAASKKRKWKLDWSRITVEVLLVSSCREKV